MIGRIIRDLAPTAENGRSSEGAFIELKDGSLLFAYSRYGCGAADDDEADIYAMLSTDNGDSFSEPYLLLSHTQVDAGNIMSVSFLRMKNDDIGMFYLAKNGDTCICYLIRSADEGKTWGKPVLCSQNHGYVVVNNDRVIRCESGKLLIPAAIHTQEHVYDADGKDVLLFHPGTLSFYASDDDGLTWRTEASSIALPNCRGCQVGVQEPGVIQLESKKLWCYIRNDTGRQYETFSYDDGKSWTQPLPSPFTSARSPMSAKRLSDGRVIALWNPVPVYNGRSQYIGESWTGRRTPLTYAFSEDNGETFTDPIPIETDENGGFCYVTIHETKDNALLLAYCAGTVEDISTLNRLRIRKIPIAEL